MHLANAQEMVYDFHKAFNIPIGDLRVPELRDKELRKNLVHEECQEFLAAIDANDMIEAIDGGCDLIYVILGSFVTWGIDLHAFFEEVHQANMAKAGGHRREDGKWMKPVGWTPPDLKSILERHIKQAKGE